MIIRRVISIFAIIIGVLCSWNVKAQYSEIKPGIYFSPESAKTPDEILLKIKNDSLYVYRSMRGVIVFDGPGPIVNSTANIVAECKLTSVGCGVYELSDTLPQNRIFKDISIEQWGKIDADSISVDIVFPEHEKSWIPFDVALIPWYDEKTVNKNSVVSFKLEPTTTGFYVALRPANGIPVTDWCYNQLGPMKYMYNKEIQVTGSHIKITIPNNVNSVFYYLNVAGEYLREISPGVIKWRGQFYYLSRKLTKKYL